MMKKNIFIILSVFIFGSHVLAFSEEADTYKKVFEINMRKAVDMAFEASEDLKIQKNEILRMKAKYDEERAALLPQINAQSVWGYNFEYPDIPLTAAKRDYSLDVGVSVEQTLFSFGKIVSDVAAAQKAIEVSRLNHQATEQEIIYNTKLAYYSAYLAKRTLNIVQESYDHVLANQRILQDRSSDGRVSRHDNIKIAADLASRMPVVNNAQATFNSAMETLKVVVGAQEEATLELAEDFQKDYPELNRKDLALSLYHHQPMIKALEESIKEKQELVKAKRGEFFPEVSAFATWDHQGEGDHYNIGSRYLEDYGVVGLKVEVPIWNGGETKAKWQQAQVDYENAKLLYQKGKKDYLLELDKAISEYQALVKTLAAHEESIRWAEESFHLSQELFKSGQISVTDLNDAELLLTNGKINKESTLFNLNILLARIERLTLRGQNE